MARFFPPDEMAELQAQEQRLRAYETFRAMASPQTAQNVTALAQTYPNMRPGTALALGKSNVTPDSPVAKAAAKAEAKRGFGWHSIGDAVSGAVGKAAKGIGAVVDPVYDAVKGVSRGMDIGLTSLGQTFQGAMRESVRDGDISGGEWLLGLPHLRKGFAQSDLAAAHREVQGEGGYGGLLTGKTDVSYGEGFFAGGDVRADAIARRRAAAPLIDGKTVTIGRYAARQVFEPGHRSYSMLSGLIDMSVALGADPLNIAAKPIRKAAEAGRIYDVRGGTQAVVALGSSDGPAKAAARAYGDLRITDPDMLRRTDQFGSDNPGIQRIVKSRDEGLLSPQEAENALSVSRPNIAVAGGLDASPRKTVLPEKVAEWLDGKDGRRLREYLVSETNFERMRQVTKGKVDVETLVRLADAKTDADILDVLGPQLGVNVREKLGVSKAALSAAQGGDGFRAKRVAGRMTRLGAQLPGDHLDIENVDIAVEEISRQARNVKMDPEQIGKWTEMMARADGINGRFAVTKQFLQEVRDEVLVQSDETLKTLRRDVSSKKAEATRLASKIETADPGPARDGLKAQLETLQHEINELQPQFDKRKGKQLTGAARTKLTRMYEDYERELRVYAIDAIGKDAKVPGAIIDGQGNPVPTAHLFVEYVNGSVPMPDARELRRATSDYARLVRKTDLGRATYDGLNALADFTTQQAFKPLVLLRGAWTVRVVGEEQIRLAASGLTSMFAHPFSHVALAMGKKGGRDIKGDALADAEELQQALSRGRGIAGDTRVVRSPHRTVLNRNDPAHQERFGEALLDEVGKLSSDPIMRRVLNGLGPGDVHPNTELTGLDAVKDWFYNGSGRTFRNDMRAADVKGDRAWLDVKTAPDGSINSADGYIDSLLERAKTTAGGDQRLLDAIATGRVNGVPLSVKGPSGQRIASRDAIKEINKLLNEGVGPEFVPGDVLVHVKNNAGSEVLRRWDSSVEFLYNTLMSRPTNFLSRNPAFQEFYWKRNIELIPRMTAETQQQAIRVARETGLPKNIIKQLEARAKTGVGDLNVAEADTVAKAFGLEQTRKLLYDLSDRNQFFDVTRAIFPFGEAWKEVATTWARIATVDNPVATRRAQQIVTGLRSADTDGAGQGFFYTDPQTGQESFNYPFSGWINERLTDVPAPLQAPAQGLNIFATSVIPGFGPVVQLSVAKLIPERPDFDSMRKLILPFGEKDTSGGILESFLPAWMNKARTAIDKDSPGQERMYANTVMDVARYLVSTGKYSMDSPEEQDRLLQAAHHRARGLYGIRAFAQFFAPSPPSPEFVTQDKNGKALMSVLLVEDYRRMQEDDYTTATERFIEKYGEGAFLTTVSKTQGGGQPNKELYDFVRENPEIPRQHADVYGYFVDGDDKFDGDAYAYQLRSGQRKPITPEKAIEIANQRLGGMVYRQAQSKLGLQPGDAPSKEQRVWLAKVRDAIATEYPGYNATPANLRDQKVLIQKLMEAADNPMLAKTEAGKALVVYRQAREEAIELARARGYTTFISANATADIREALRRLAGQLSVTYPAFTEMFERTLNREMKSDDDEVAA